MPRRRARARRRTRNATDGLSQPPNSRLQRTTPASGGDTLRDGRSGQPAMPGPVYDSIYTGETALGRANYETDLAGINLSRGRIGYDTGFDANGNPDLSNPYNQAMMLQRAHDQAARGVTNSFAAQGQLYSRARQRNADENDFQYERSRNQLQTGAQRAYQDLSLQEQGAGNALAENQFNAGVGQADRWANQQRDWYSRYA